MLPRCKSHCSCYRRQTWCRRRCLAISKLMIVPNPKSIGGLHGMLPVHVGMQIRLLAPLDLRQGLVKDAEGKSNLMQHKKHMQRASVPLTRGPALLPKESNPVELERYQSLHHKNPYKAPCNAPRPYIYLSGALQGAQNSTNFCKAYCAMCNTRCARLVVITSVCTYYVLMSALVLVPRGPMCRTDQ